jgi:hypothetical protein
MEMVRKSITRGLCAPTVVAWRVDVDGDGRKTRIE